MDAPNLPAGEPGSVLTLGGQAYDLSTRPLVMGILNRTRDSFFQPGVHYQLLGRPLGVDEGERGTATVAACTAGALAGARILRVHDVRAGRQVADLVAALLSVRRDGGPPAT